MLNISKRPKDLPDLHAAQHQQLWEVCNVFELDVGLCSLTHAVQACPCDFYFCSRGQPKNVSNRQPGHLSSSEGLQTLGLKSVIPGSQYS